MTGPGPSGSAGADASDGSASGSAATNCPPASGTSGADASGSGAADSRAADSRPAGSRAPSSRAAGSRAASSGAGAGASRGNGSAVTAREEVLARIRRANRAAGPVTPAEVPRGYRHTGEHPPGAPELVELLRDRLVDYRATVVDCEPDGVPAAIAGALADVTGPVVLPPGLPASWCPTGVVDGGVSDGADAGPAAAPRGRLGAGNPGFTAAELDRFAAVVTGCAAACAETGTIALDSSPDQGRRAITLVPDLHVCVVRADQVVHTVPELLAVLTPDRPITFISGPSATSDIELQRVEGVHGPRTLIVVLVH
jgi:L-lactate dehydrogenase complex protein LldG